MPITPYSLPARIDKFFQEFVNKPFEEHERSDAWVNEVVNRDRNYRTKTIIDRGRTDFSQSWNGLSPKDKILIYCYYYMQMHSVSGFHVFQHGWQDHRLNFVENVVVIDLGCGPLTSAVSLAWHYLTQHPTAEEGLLFHYLGIDRCEAMLVHAQEAGSVGNLFHKNSTFEFMTPAQALETVPRLIESYRSALNGNDLTIILNCSYLFASHHLKIGGLIAFVSWLLKDYLANDKVCLVFQNPDNDALNTKWERFKSGVTELRGLSRNADYVYYYDVTGRDRGQISRIRLRREFLLNHKLIAAGEVIPF